MNDRDPALERALDIVGGPKLLAEALGDCTPQAVSQWKQAPALRVLSIERATGGQVTRYELRPDLYPIEDAAQ